MCLLVLKLRLLLLFTEEEKNVHMKGVMSEIIGVQEGVKYKICTYISHQYELYDILGYSMVSVSNLLLLLRPLLCRNLARMNIQQF